MDARARFAFLAVIAAQAAHSIEEYWFRLYDLLAPTRLLSEAIGPDRATGFLIGNAAILLAGLVCYFASVRRGHGSARGLAWFWALLEIANGLGHVALALWARGYFPGLATAPLLLATGLHLATRLSRSRPPTKGDAA
ncbi:MAG TPA: HXXEE domain-containing protein [Allosphingosinicella sp.]|nr:HXXEE domain-containing protein [Allosphingosinicella sp.]